jgi:hypothetical protein
MALTKTNLANIVEGILPVANGGTGTSTGVAPGGSTTQVQYNNAGAFGGDSGFVYTGGNVGIGTTSPSGRLNVVTAGGAENSLRMTGSTTAASFINFSNTGGNAYIGLDNSAGTGFGGTAYSYNLYYGSAYPILFWTNGTERFRIGSAGQLGIGGATYGTSGQVLTSGGASAAPTWGSVTLPAGTVRQVVQTNLTSSFTSTSSSWNDWTGLSASITPASTSSKILVMIYGMVSNLNTNTWQMVKVVRGGSDMVIGDAQGSATRCWIDGSFGASQNPNWGRTISGSYLDSPGVSSSITYQAQVINTNGGTAYWGRSASVSDANRSSTPSTLILMEITG